MLQELRYAVRILARTPAFALSAMVALALGIGANTATFSVIHAVLLKPLPYAEPDRLVRVYEANDRQGVERGDVSPVTVSELSTRSRSFDRIAVYVSREWLVRFDSDYERLAGATVSASLFPLLGVAPALGRTFDADEHQPPPLGDEVVIGYELWQRRFGGAADVLGRTVWIEGRIARRIVGVMPRGFDFPAGAEIWGAQRALRTFGLGDAQARHEQAVARLRTPVSIDDARVELAGISAQLAEEYRESHAGFHTTIEPLDRAIAGSVRPALLAMAAVVGCVLLIACANVASLMLARAAERRRELAVRWALGATTLRLLRQTLAEMAVLSAGGLAGGLVLAWWGTRALIAAAPGGIPRLEAAGLDWVVLAFTAGLATACAIVTATVPALQVAFGEARGILNRSGRSTPVRARARSAILAIEVALTLVSSSAPWCCSAASSAFAAWIWDSIPCASSRWT